MAIDLFNPEGAILSVAHYLVTHGWDTQSPHQQHAIYTCYGGHYETDKNKYYMKAVLKYVKEMSSYLKDHPVETPSTSLSQSLIPEGKQTSRNQRIEQPPNWTGLVQNVFIASLYLADLPQCSKFALTLLPKCFAPVLQNEQ